MSRYIDIEPYEDYVLQRYYRNSMGECVETVPLCGLPIADVAEVRHGRWVRGDEMADYPRVPYNPWETYCSCCGEIMEQSHDNFCGNCGAKMDEVEE